MTIGWLVLLGFGVGLLSAVPLTLGLAFNMLRYRRLMKKTIHPMLVEHGLRKPDDPWVSSGIRDELKEYEKQAGAAVQQANARR